MRAHNLRAHACCWNKVGGKSKTDDSVPKIIVPTPQSLIHSYETVEEISNYILKETKVRPKYGVICSSGLGILSNLIEDAKLLTYMEIPYFPITQGKEGHAGQVHVGTLRGARVIIMVGRFNTYEGYALANCTLPVRVMKLCGVEYLIISSASGAINSTYSVGDIMVLRDHINFLSQSPLQGPNDPRFGPRFPSLVNAYDRRLIQKALDVGTALGIENNMHVGVYACLGGPVFETPAEQTLLRRIGVDTVGMSTVHEVITARHCNMKVFAFSIITAPALDHVDTQGELTIEDTLAILKSRQLICLELVARLIYSIENDPDEEE